MEWNPLLTADEEISLAAKIEAGVFAAALLAGHPTRVESSRAELERVAAEGEQARQQFLLANLRMVAFATNGMALRDSAVPRDELFQEGVVAMAEALGRYDWQKGRFVQMAFPAIKGRAQAFVASRGGSLGVPAGRAIAIRRARAIAARLESETGGPAAVSDVAAELGRGQASTIELLHHRSPVSINSMEPDAQERLLTVPSEGRNADGDIDVDLSRLTTQQREIITLRYGLADGKPRSYLQVAEETGASESTVRRSCELGLNELRRAAAEPADEAAHKAKALAAAGTLKEVDRLSSAGLSLVEVAIALKTDPGALHDICQAGHRQDLLIRFGKLGKR